MSTFPVIYREQITEEVGQTPDEYLPMLLQIVRSFRQSVALKPADESFRQGWEEVRAGETLPVSELWDRDSCRMSPAPSTSVEVRFTPEFKRNLHALAKKYRNIRADIEPIIKALQSGQQPGDQVPGIGYKIYKLRIGNRDARKGKSGRYRIIYYVQTPIAIVLVTIYSKSEQSDITAAQIRRILRELDDATES